MNSARSSIRSFKARFEHHAPQPTERPKTTAKVLLLGAQGVGKTCILLRQTNEGFSDKMKPTIGASFAQSTLELPDATVTLHLWDTAGQERFRSLVTMYYRNAAGAFLVYDITDNTSFLQIKCWIEELNRNVGKPVLYCLVGNKTDLEDQREVSTKTGQEYADSIGALFFETSARSNIGIHEAFIAFAAKLYEDESSRAKDSYNGFYDRYNNDVLLKDDFQMSRLTSEENRKCFRC